MPVNFRYKVGTWNVGPRHVTLKNWNDLDLWPWAFVTDTFMQKTYFRTSGTTEMS